MVWVFEGEGGVFWKLLCWNQLKYEYLILKHKTFNNNTLIITYDKTVTPVSYTHLDVYKRQVYLFTQEKLLERGPHVY